MLSNNNHEQIKTLEPGPLTGLLSGNNSQRGTAYNRFLHPLFPIVLICIASRIAFMGDYLEGWDDVDFALALHDYDISRYQPHFPGYPVYIFFCRLVSKIFCCNDVLALTLPGAVFGALTILPLYLLARDMFSRKAALVTALLFVVNPLCWLQSERPTSDSMGMFFLILSAQLLFASLRSTDRRSIICFVAGGIVFALTLGVRLSYLPFIAIWVFALIRLCGQRGRFVTICCGVASLAFGLMLWLIPLICLVNFTNLAGNALAFTHGHFTDWGGTVGTSPQVGSRLFTFSQRLLSEGLGFWWYDTHPVQFIPSVIMIMGVLTTCRGAMQRATAISNEKAVFILVFLIPYSVWVILCQNLEKPRHVLPLVPLLLICISNGLVRISRNKFFMTVIIGIITVAVGIGSIRPIMQHKLNPPIRVQVLNYIVDNFDKLSTRLYCWETKRLFDYYAPEWDARRARDINDLRYDVNSSLTIPETVLCTSQVEGTTAPDVDGATLLRRFRTDRYVDNPCSEVSLYLIDSDSDNNFKNPEKD